MKHFLLKFNHGVEIGARLAYLGHYERTKDLMILHIADEEESHRATLAKLLHKYRTKSSNRIDRIFTVIGNAVARLCQISPIFMLNFVARSMEIFAVFSYNKLATKYPAHRKMFREMARTEERHKRYFK